MRQLKITKQFTNRDSQSLDKYLQEISRVELISTEEEVALSKKIKNGDEEALSKLVEANLRFVVSVAKQYLNYGLTLPDLINEGNIGLIKAAKRFDETRGFKFISYAVWWIRQSILQAIAEQSRIVRLPLNKIGSISKINRAFSKLEQDFEREPSPDEVADALEMFYDDVNDIVKAGSKTLSLDLPINQEEENTMRDILPNVDTPSPDKKLINESLAFEVERALSTIPAREAKILKLYFGIGVEQPYSLEEIGLELNITRERVRQIKGKALKRIQFTTRCRILKSYLG
jgi:RNA polymerase primary sigma factor